MTRHKKPSFWDEPEWYTRWRNSRACTFLWLASWFFWAANAAGHGRWAEVYAIASPLLAAAVAYLLGWLPGTCGPAGPGAGSPEPGAADRVNCFTLLLAVPVAGAAGFLIFGMGMLRYKATVLLLAASVVCVLWLLMMLIASLLPRIRLRPRPPSFMLDTGAGRERHLSRDDFLAKLRTCLEEYGGRFVIVERDPAADARAGQYVFYEPQDLLEDSYPQSDVESIERLISAVLSAGGTHGAVAVMIPSASVKDIGTYDDEPLLREDPARITGRPLDVAGLLVYLDQLTAAYNCPGCEFRMNAPKGAEGIYLWRNYV